MQPGYQPSAPAVHTASTLLKNFDINALGRVEANNHNVAVIVDVCTQIYRLAPTITLLTREIPWHQPKVVVERMDLLRQRVQELGVARSKMPRYNGGAGEGQPVGSQQGQQVSAAALHSARMLLRNFEFVRKAKLKPTERTLAVLVDVCTDVFRVERAIDQITQSSLWGKGAELQPRLNELRRLVRELELLKNRLPVFPTTPKLVIAARDRPEPCVPKEKAAELRQLQTLVAAATTVQEQQAVLAKAGIVSSRR